MYTLPEFELEKSAKSQTEHLQNLHLWAGRTHRVSRLYEQLFLHFLVKVAHESHYF